MNRRQFLQGATVAAAVPVLGACAGEMTQAYLI